MATDVKVPVLGESITEATLGAWLKQPGDAVTLDEPIASLETDKVAVEVPSPIAGVMGEQVVKEGETVAVGAVIARIEEGAAGAAPAKAAPEADPAAAPAPVNPPGAGESPALKGDPHAPVSEAAGSAADASLTLSPAVRRAVLEHHVDPSKLHGTGKDGRLTKDDVLAAAKGTPSTRRRPGPRRRRRKLHRFVGSACCAWTPAFAWEQDRKRVGRCPRLRKTIATRLRRRRTPRRS